MLSKDTGVRTLQPALLGVMNVWEGIMRVWKGVDR